MNSTVTLLIKNARKKRAHAIIARFATVEAVEAAFAELQALWEELLSKYHVQSDDAPVVLPYKPGRHELEIEL